RVIKMLREQGVELSKSTAHGLIRKSFDLLDRLSPSLREAILSDPYITVDKPITEFWLRKSILNLKEARRVIIGGYSPTI
ncbi:MAG: IS66 family transposase, partial [Marinifilaceae bacterium]